MWTTANTRLHSWVEPGEASVKLQRADRSLLLEWRNEDVAEAITDGDLNPRDLHQSAVDTANEWGIE